jgi:hypothetical protein
MPPISQTKKSVKITQRIVPSNVQSSATATGGKASNGTMIIKFHLLVETEGAVAVGCSVLLAGVPDIPVPQITIDK